MFNPNPLSSFTTRLVFVFLVQTCQSTEKTTSYCDTSNIATMRSDITKWFGDHKTWAVNAGLWRQSLGIKENGLLTAFYCVALTNNDRGRYLLWKRMSSFSSDSGLLRPEFRTARRQVVFSVKVFYRGKGKTLHPALRFWNSTLEWSDTCPHRPFLGVAWNALWEMQESTEWGKIIDGSGANNPCCHRFSLDPFQVTSLPWYYNLEATARPIKPIQRRAPWENRPTRAAALGHLTRLGSNACLLLQDTRDLWGWYVCLCVLGNTEDAHTHTHTHTEEKELDQKLNMLNIMSHKNQRDHTSCWHGSGSRGEAHHHPAPWDNWRKARALWVMLLINSIQQTLRRNDYLSRTAPLSPAMLIIVVSLWAVFLFSFFFLFSPPHLLFLPHISRRHAFLSPCIWDRLLSNHQNLLLSAKSLVIKWSNGWWMTRYYEMKILLALKSLFRHFPANRSLVIFLLDLSVCTIHVMINGTCSDLSGQLRDNQTGVSAAGDCSSLRASF